MFNLEWKVKLLGVCHRIVRYDGENGDEGEAPLLCCWILTTRINLAYS